MTLRALMAAVATATIVLAASALPSQAGGIRQDGRHGRRPPPRTRKATTTGTRWAIPVSFEEQVLCVHAGWHYRAARTYPERHVLAEAYRRPPDYWQGSVAFYRTDDVPDGIAGGSGEGGWTAVSDPRYGGGLSFTIGTWNRAADLSHGRIPRASSTQDIAHAPPVEQMYAAWMIVSARGNWGDWPQTSRACGFL